jgi:hypothetical protein
LFPTLFFLSFSSILSIDGYVWSGLMRALALFLKPAGTASLVSFFHDAFKDAVKKRYLSAKNSSRMH